VASLPAVLGVEPDRPAAARGTLGRALRRRLPAVLASVGLLVAGLVFSFWWNLHVDHAGVWYEPADLWRTTLAATRLVRGDLGGLYSNGTNLVSLPGAAIILAPAAAVIVGFHLPLGPPIGPSAHTLAWVVLLPWTLLLASSVLFATDRLARHLGVSWPRRLLLAGAETVALWNVVPYWGHPEDCVAVALLLFALDAAAFGRPARSAWLVGFALGVQPLVALAVPVLAVTATGARLRPTFAYLGRAALPPALVLAVALGANWSATWYHVVVQPNWPHIDRPTPWMVLAPRLTSQTVAAGPGRSLAAGLACLVAWPAWRSWQRAQRTGGRPASGPGPWAPAALASVVWWVALALALRCAFESVMVAYYLWPGLAVGMLAASVLRWRLVLGVAVAVAVTLFCNTWWQAEWAWWLVVLAGLAAELLAAYPAPLRRGRAAPPEPRGSRPQKLLVAEAGRVGPA
jgi:hypothetical protein